ncbi:hypothetical protein Scep_005442 [Stephania cephalantha]|uniref:C2H2-type domain-containing protein n=1 Tax=Stephania cephalantha TaxID=152367 RepID=A0AAP0KVR4_9MAGN
METSEEQPCLENQDQVASPTKEDQQSPSGATDHQAARSYECNFCKRGFSNAQALGGHMNIHRKDRAKLKQPSSNHISTDFSKMNAFYNPEGMTRLELLSNNTSDSTLRWPWIFPKERDDHEIMPRIHNEDRVGTIYQLPLFVEAPMNANNDEELVSHGSEERARSSPSSSVKEDLDLELRLGTEPQHDHDAPSSTGTTIEFF